MIKKFSTVFIAAAAIVSEAFCADYNPRDFGAKADAKTNDAHAIQAAIDAAYKDGGGTVKLDSGKFLSGTIYLKDNVKLEIQKGATLLGSTDKNDYNPPDAFAQNFAANGASSTHLIVAVETKNIEICGGGTIDGNGLEIWLSNPQNKTTAPESKFAYPKWRTGQMIFICESQNVKVRNLNIVNPTYWSTLFFGCENVIISGLFVKNDYRGHNQDGIDIDACDNVAISDCIVDTEDDSFLICTTRGELLKKKQNVCRNISISNCIARTRDCNAIRIGVGTGAIKNVTISNFIVSDTRTGISIHSEYSAQGFAPIENIRFSNCIIDAKNPVAIYSHNTRWGREKGSGSISEISFSNCSFNGERTNVIGADKNRNISDINFNACLFTTHGGDKITDTKDFSLLKEWGGVESVAHAFVAVNARNLKFTDTRFNWRNTSRRWESAVVFENCENSVAPEASETPECPAPSK